MSPHDVKASNGAAPEEDASELQGVGDNNNPMPHLIPEGENATPLEVLGCTATDKLLIIMVGVSILHLYCWIKNCLRIFSCQMHNLS